LAFEQPASLLNYLSENTLIAIDEPEQCHAHSDRWVKNAEEQWGVGNRELGIGNEEESSPTSLKLPKIHRSFDECLADVAKFKTLYYRNSQRKMMELIWPADLFQSCHTSLVN
jgi:transcription-repair coupling factor (superfamily II helicase)